MFIAYTASTIHPPVFVNEIGSKSAHDTKPSHKQTRDNHTKCYLAACGNFQVVVLNWCQCLSMSIKSSSGPLLLPSSIRSTIGLTLNCTVRHCPRIELQSIIWIQNQALVVPEMQSKLNYLSLWALEAVRIGDILFLCVRSCLMVVKEWTRVMTIEKLNKHMWIYQPCVKSSCHLCPSTLIECWLNERICAFKPSGWIGIIWLLWSAWFRFDIFVGFK